VSGQTPANAPTTPFTKTKNNKQPQKPACENSNFDFFSFLKLDAKDGRGKESKGAHCRAHAALCAVPRPGPCRGPGTLRSAHPRRSRVLPHGARGEMRPDLQRQCPFGNDFFCCFVCFCLIGIAKVWFCIFGCFRFFFLFSLAFLR
jgi:hypothetical protein